MKKDFVWGAASASYQIEGGVAEDGRSPSIWDVFSHIPGKVRYNETGDRASDSYHRLEEDLDLLAQLKIPNYRFSISWSRILPNGRGEINPKGLEYYDRLVDGCIERGIEPWITIFHWDLPQVLQDTYGGWQGEEISDDFAAYALTVCRHFYGRVSHYFIMNEPQCFINLGYLRGEFAPGLTLEPAEYVKCWNNMLLAHGKAVKAIREEMPDLKLGVASTGKVFYPDTDESKDIEAARCKNFRMDDFTWGYSNSMYLDPICLGRYPDCSGTPLAEAIAEISEEDLKVIAQKPDFIGINVYNGDPIIADENGDPHMLSFHEGYPRTAAKWPITPRILRYFPKYVGDRYGLPVYISENGMSNGDFIYPDGKVHDPQRIAYLESYLDNLENAIAEGAPVEGYFQWSLLDNFEWASGYDERFGLVYVDYPTGERTIKDSAIWYSNYIQKQQTSVE